MTTTPGRNDPCHCGSGVKFKKCHGDPALARKNPGPYAANGPASAGIDAVAKQSERVASFSYKTEPRAPWSLPTSEEEFEAYMRRMDEWFISRQLPVPARMMAALFEASGDQQSAGISANIFATPKSRTPAPGVFRGVDLALRIEAWYVRTYGDRVNVELGMGSTVVMLRGDVWEYKFPGGHGAALFYARDLATGPAMYLQGKTGPTWLGADDAMRVNPPWQPVDVLRGVVGLPDGMLSQLTDAEMRSVLELFIMDWQSLHWITQARHHTLGSSALADYRAGVRHLTARPPELGQARWSAQQGAEKMVKCYLAHATGDYLKKGPNAHNLRHLTDLAAQAGGPTIPDRFIERVDCKPGIRYGDEDPGTAADVVERFRLALSFGGLYGALVTHKYPVPSRYAGDGKRGDGNDFPRDLLGLMWERSGIPETDSPEPDEQRGAS